MGKGREISQMWRVAQRAKCTRFVVDVSGRCADKKRDVETSVLTFIYIRDQSFNNWADFKFFYQTLDPVKF